MVVFDKNIFNITYRRPNGDKKKRKLKQEIWKLSELQKKQLWKNMQQI
jgi:hypothetical protein